MSVKLVVQREKAAFSVGEHGGQFVGCQRAPCSPVGRRGLDVPMPGLRIALAFRPCHLTQHAAVGKNRDAPARPLRVCRHPPHFRGGIVDLIVGSVELGAVADVLIRSIRFAHMLDQARDACRLNLASGHDNPPIAQLAHGNAVVVH